MALNTDIKLMLKILYIINIVQPVKYVDAFSLVNLFLAKEGNELIESTEVLLNYLNYLESNLYIINVRDDSYSLTKKGLDFIGKVMPGKSRDKNRLLYLRRNYNWGSSRRLHRDERKLNKFHLVGDSPT